MNKTQFAEQIKEIFITKENDGSYNLFGDYIIKQKKNGMFLILRLDNRDFENVYFSNIKYAVTYCVFEKNNKYLETERLIELDRYIGALEVNIVQNKKLLNNSEIPEKFIHLAKLNENQLKKKNALKEMERYAVLSKHIQNKKYQQYLNEK